MLTKANISFKTRQKKLFFDFLIPDDPELDQYLNQLNTVLSSLKGHRRHQLLTQVQKVVKSNKNTEALLALVIERSEFESPLFGISEKRTSLLKVAKQLREDQSIECREKFLQMIEETQDQSNISEFIYSDILGNQKLSDIAVWQNSEWVETFNYESLAWLLKQTKTFSINLKNQNKAALDLLSSLPSMFSCIKDGEGLKFYGPKNKLKRVVKLKSSQAIELAEYLAPRLIDLDIEAQLIISGKTLEWTH